MSEFVDNMMQFHAEHEPWIPDAMSAQQADQRRDQEERDEELKRIVRKIITVDYSYVPFNKSMTVVEIKTLCDALKINIRDVT